MKVPAENGFSTCNKEVIMKLPLITAGFVTMYALLATAWLCYAGMRHVQLISLF
ncbi:MAG: hypothetical protein H6R04_1432 [Burkholderiaceae bacterium]|nr:hypothetical protein [Burkholderiaceae bacterium]